MRCMGSSRRRSTLGRTASELWGGPLSGGNGAAVLLNRGTKAANISLTWAELGVKESPATVTDAWSGEVTKVSCPPPGQSAAVSA